MTHILMIAAENDALPGAKVGGIGDVVRDVPFALAAKGFEVTVLTPAYGVFARMNGAKHLARLEAGFGGGLEILNLFEVPGRKPTAGVRHCVLDHSLFSSCGEGRIYCDDSDGRPFATDASKFALFCAAAAEAITRGAFNPVDVIHLHDWHAAMLLLLRQYKPEYEALKSIRCAYTIHNLALQGIRPFSGSDSSLDEWFPGLCYNRELIADPRWSNCVNPMAVGIRLADAVHAVSPTYAEEILLPSDIRQSGRYGGEGLEQDLKNAKVEGRLFGILNGCEYPQKSARPEADWDQLLNIMRSELLLLAGTGPTVSSTIFIADKRISALDNNRPKTLLTSVGRITDQKMRLFRQQTSTGHSALEAMLETLGEHDLFIMVGSGDPVYEQFLTATAAKYSNFIFLRGYCELLGDVLYQQGDLFLMPSSFEPCGISQMLAMREGQPCLVHRVGGLRDTVQDEVTGFAFSGDNPVHQADNFVATVGRALETRKKPKKWQEMRHEAAANRFHWADSIDAYLRHLYQLPGNA